MSTDNFKLLAAIALPASDCRQSGFGTLVTFWGILQFSIQPESSRIMAHNAISKSPGR